MKNYTEEDLQKAFRAGFFTFYFEVCTTKWNKEKDFKKAWEEYQQKLNKITLIDLVGEHLFSGIDVSEEKYEGQSCEVINFILDDITYKVIENPSDGWRSYLGDIKISNEKILNTFPPQKVIIKKKKSDKYQTNNTIQFFDAINKKLILEIGTDNADDWYPYCVMEYHPENMEINKDK